MAAKVFISYAGRDPQWPPEAVRELGLMLEKHGATVLLDQFHLERQAEPGKLSALEWIGWMNAAIGEADRVICLVSTRYAEAEKRNLEEVWGYGVAHESQKLMIRLYLNKGLNDKRLLTVRPDGVPLDLVPEYSRHTCPEYQWPSEQRGALEHALIRRLTDSEAQAFQSSAKVQSNHRDKANNAYDGAGQSLSRHAQVTIDVLSVPEARQFFSALCTDLSNQPGSPVWTRGEVGAFVRGVSEAEPRWARIVMLGVRRVVKRLTGRAKPDEATSRAAIALTMFCACRWVVRLPEAQPGTVVQVPLLRHHALAVLSASMFGGEVALVPNELGTSAPKNFYEVHGAPSADKSASLLGALYEQLYRERKDATDIAQRDSFPPELKKRLLADVIVRMENIRAVDESSFTLVIREPAAWAEADWSSALDVCPFVLEPELSLELFAMPPDELEAMIHELWLLVQPETQP